MFNLTECTHLRGAIIMAINNNNFLDTKFEIPEITRFRLVVGLLIGFFYSFSFYSFLYIIREVFRFLSLTEANDLWILTVEESNFYNLIFAFISVILGQSMSFTFWFDRPKRIFGKQNHRSRRIVNDQRVLNWYFLSWFSKLCFVSVVMFGFTIQGGFYALSLYPDYNYIFILILIVLFFQTWNTIILKYKRKSYKWILFSIVILSVSSFGLSRINLIDYKSINKIVLQKNTPSKYNLELPKTNSFKKGHRYFKNIYIVESKNQGFKPKPKVVIDNQEFDFNGIKDQIAYWQSKKSKWEIRSMVYRLHIHKTINMKFINKLKKELAINGVQRIAYAVIPIYYEFDSRFDQGFSFKWRLFNWDSGLYNPKEILNHPNKIQNIIVVKQDDSGNRIVNDVELGEEQFKLNIKGLMKQDHNYIIPYFINDNVNFTEYLGVLTIIKDVVNELRNEYSVKTYSKQFDSLNNVDRKLVRKQYPLSIIEIPKEQALSFLEILD